VAFGDGAEMLGEIQLGFAGDILIVEHQHRMVVPRLPDGVDGGVVRTASEIDAADLRPDDGLQLCYGDGFSDLQLCRYDVPPSQCEHDASAFDCSGTETPPTAGFFLLRHVVACTPTFVPPTLVFRK
jgi:hypothetical protein